MYCYSIYCTETGSMWRLKEAGGGALERGGSQWCHHPNAEDRGCGGSEEPLQHALACCLLPHKEPSLMQSPAWSGIHLSLSSFSSQPRLES